MDDLNIVSPTLKTAVMAEEMVFSSSLPPFFSTVAPEGNMSLLVPENMTCNYDLRLLDVSEFDYPYRMETWIPITWREIFKILAYVVAFLVSLAGNLLVILVVYHNANMRTSSTNRYLVNLAAADLLVTLVCMWVHIVRHLSHPNYVLPAIVCKMDSFVQATTVLASVLTLTVISVGRFVAVMFPLRARTSPVRAYRVIAAVWITSALLACPTIFYRQYYSIQWKNFTSWQCDEIWPSESRFDPQLGYCVQVYDAKKLFYTAFTIVLYFLPVGIMIINYSLVVWKLWVNVMPGEQSAPARNTATRAKKKVVKMVSVVLMVFVFCWTPLQTIILYSNFVHAEHNSLPSWFASVEFTAYFVAYSNSALNPIIYCGFNASFRQGLVSLLTCRKSSSGRIYYHRNWKGLTNRTRETTEGCSGPEPAILVEFTTSKKNRFGPSGRSLISTSREAHNSLSDSGSELVSKRSFQDETFNGSQSHMSGGATFMSNRRHSDGLRGRPLEHFSRGLGSSITGKYTGRGPASPLSSEGLSGCRCCRRKSRRKEVMLSHEQQVYELNEVRDNTSNGSREDML